MAMFISRQSKTMKRVTDPLDEKVRAQLMSGCCYYVSSGSDHDGTLCLSDLVNNYLINEEERYSSGDCSSSINRDCCNNGVCSDCDDHHDTAAILNSLLEEFKTKDSFRLRLLKDVCDAMESIGDNRRAVVTRLREMGYSAGLCKAKWELCGGLAAGSYEYMDVVAKDNRYIIDLRFASEFEIARATQDYSKAVAELPNVMVGTADEVRQVVRVLGHAARRSLGRAEMHVPPWRKTRYFLSKWLGPYKRITNPVPSTIYATATADGVELLDSVRL